MYQHLLVPVDGTDLSERAAESALLLAQRLGARVTAFCAEPMPPIPAVGASGFAYASVADAHFARTDKHAREVLNRIVARAAELGVTCTGEFRRTENVDGAIVDAAQGHGCDLIVMATHGRSSLGELMFGSHTKSVLAQCKLPVLVLR